MDERDKTDTLQCVLLILSSLVIKEIWVFLPEYVNCSSPIKPFPFYDIEIYPQTYVSYPCDDIGRLMLIYLIGKKLVHYKPVAEAWFILQSIEFVDYFFTYNTAWFKVGDLGIGITFTTFTVLTVITLERIWSQTKPSRI